MGRGPRLVAKRQKLKVRITIYKLLLAKNSGIGSELMEFSRSDSINRLLEFSGVIL